jgi:hypothetical protein
MAEPMASATPEEQAIIKAWEEQEQKADANIDELWDVSHNLLLHIKPEFVEQALKAIDEEDIYEDEGDVAIDAFMPSFMGEVSEETFLEWIAAYHNAKREWIEDYTISG